MRHTTQYKWDAQQECYIPHEKAMLALGHTIARKTARTFIIACVGAVPNRTFAWAYKHSSLVKQACWYARSTR